MHVYSNTTLVKVKLSLIEIGYIPIFIQIQHLLKLNSCLFQWIERQCAIQIQHLLKLNANILSLQSSMHSYSNTTLVKVK